MYRRILVSGWRLETGEIADVAPRPRTTTDNPSWNKTGFDDEIDDKFLYICISILVLLILLIITLTILTTTTIITENEIYEKFFNYEEYSVDNKTNVIIDRNDYYEVNNWIWYIIWIIFFLLFYYITLIQRLLGIVDI